MRMLTAILAVRGQATTLGLLMLLSPGHPRQLLTTTQRCLRRGIRRLLARKMDGDNA